MTTYVIASTSYLANETYIFPADETGKITDYGEIGGVAERWGCSFWEDHDLTMNEVFGPDHKYEQVDMRISGHNGPQTLYKLVS